MFYCLLDVSCGEWDVIFWYFMCCSVNGSVYLVCCVFVNCLMKQFAMCLGVVAILLLNVIWKRLVWVDVLCWIDHVWSSGEYACCAFDPSVHLSVPSVGFICLIVCWKLN